MLPPPPRTDRVAEFGYVPAYATAAPTSSRQTRARRAGRLTDARRPTACRAAEFEQMKRELGLERASLAATALDADQAPRPRTDRRTTPPRPARRQRARAVRDHASLEAGRRRPGSGPSGRPATAPRRRQPRATEPRPQPAASRRDVTPAPDVAENEGMARRGPEARVQAEQRATAATGDVADGRARLGDDGPRDLALHDLAARPLLGRDRRRPDRSADRRDPDRVDHPRILGAVAHDTDR